jgi:hypothetical protein
LLQNATALAEDARESYNLWRSLNFPLEADPGSPPVERCFCLHTFLGNPFSKSLIDGSRCDGNCASRWLSFCAELVVLGTRRSDKRKKVDVQLAHSRPRIHVFNPLRFYVLSVVMARLLHWSTTPPGNRVHCTIRKRSGTRASGSRVSSMTTGKMKGTPLAILTRAEQRVPIRVENSPRGGPGCWPR